MVLPQVLLGTGVRQCFASGQQYSVALHVSPGLGCCDCTTRGSRSRNKLEASAGEGILCCVKRGAGRCAAPPAGSMHGAVHSHRQ